jgi:hypothetical protein
MANGFANRFLYCLVKRSKLLAHGGHLDDGEIVRLGERMKIAVEFARKVGRVRMTDEGARAWEAAYPELSAERPGLLGAVIARAEAQSIRLALIFALLDSKTEIGTIHLDAALAVWAYCEESAVRIFGDSLGDPVADDILLALGRNKDGMTRTQISAHLGRHRSATEINAALALIAKMDRARVKTGDTGGRPTETWVLAGTQR